MDQYEAAQEEVTVDGPNSYRFRGRDSCIEYQLLRPTSRVATIPHRSWAEFKQQLQTIRRSSV